MRKAKFFAAALLAMSSLGAFAQHQFTVQANKPGAEIQPTMYGIFFEDINFGADGGLYAEMVENRSFEFPQRLMGWNTFGNVTLSDVKPAFDRNPHYVTLESAGAREKQTGLENRGFFGMGLKKDMKYDFTVYGRLHLIDGKQGKIRVELVNSKNDVIAKQVITITNNKWQKLTATLTSPQTDAKGLMRVYLEKGSESVDLDHISLFPEDNWNGLRADLVQDLALTSPTDNSHVLQRHIGCCLPPNCHRLSIAAGTCLPIPSCWMVFCRDRPSCRQGLRNTRLHCCSTR